MAENTRKPDRGHRTDWGPVVDQAIAGDRVAYARLARLVTGHLAHWRAYDFRSDWEDMVQDVLLSVVGAHREGRFATPGDLLAYLRQATRFRFIDRIRASNRRGPGVDLEDYLEQGDAGASWPPQRQEESGLAEMRLSVARAVEALPERERLAVLEVYVRGQTYEQAANSTGIPLGSLKRSLRSGLAQLRKALDDGGPAGR